MGQRILDPTALLGTRSLLVDGQGNGDFSSIQSALDYASLFATAASRWSVRVAPGAYAESLALKDYVDLAALAPGQAAKVCPASNSAIRSAATCCVSDLWLSSSDAAVIQNGTGFSGSLELLGVRTEQTMLDIPSLSWSSGSLLARDCWLACGGPVQVSGGTASFHNVAMRNQAAEDGGSNIALYLQGGTALLHGCLVENVSPAGYAVYIDAAISSLRLVHSTLRVSNATYAIHTTLAVSAALACCCGNAAQPPQAP